MAIKNMQHKITSKPLFALGIAGNSAGHLQQTGESRAFDEINDANKPQALFPFYMSASKEAYLAIDPCSSERLQLPSCEQAKVQMEPELALKLTAQYDTKGKLTSLTPIAMTLVNDATYRNATVDKLAQKKNWGVASKGLATHEITVSDFSVNSDLNNFRLCGFHLHNGLWHVTGEDVALTQYSYFYDKLLDWLLIQIAQQSDSGLSHNIQALLAEADYPDSLLIAVGATRYSDYGEQHQLLSGDQSVVVLYDSNYYDFMAVRKLIEQHGDLNTLNSPSIIFLQQKVI